MGSPRTYRIRRRETEELIPCPRCFRLSWFPLKDQVSYECRCGYRLSTRDLMEAGYEVAPPAVEV